MFRRSLLISFAIILAVSGFFALAACEETPPTGVGGHAGAGGAGGGCPENPQPMFTVTITAADGPVPSDTSLAVTWSAGAEPTFSLAEPATWTTLEQGANVVCNVDPKTPPPTALEALICRLWTSGPTEITIKANSYLSHTETLVPAMSDRCEGPLPKEVAITLLRDLDAGPSP